MTSRIKLRTKGKRAVIFLCLVLNLYSVLSLSVTEYTGGSLQDGTHVFYKSKSPYTVRNDIIIEKNAEVIFEPGVEIRFDPSVGVIVRGTLTAEGRDDDEIILTSSRQISKTSQASRIRLVDGFSTNEGRLQIYYKKQWRSVCTNSKKWSQNEYDVVCRGLGYRSGSFFQWYNEERPKRPRILLNPKCNGPESDIFDCKFFDSLQMGGESCNYHPDLGVKCHNFQENFHWKGLIFENSAKIQKFEGFFKYDQSRSRIKNLKIYYAGNDRDFDSGSAILVLGTPPVFEKIGIFHSKFTGLNITAPKNPVKIFHSNFRDNFGSGVFINSSFGNVEIKNSSFEKNMGHGIFYFSKSGPDFFGSDFSKSPEYITGPGPDWVDFCSMPLTSSQIYPVKLSVTQNVKNHLSKSCQIRLSSQRGQILTVDMLGGYTSKNDSAFFKFLDFDNRVLAFYTVKNDTKYQSVKSTSNFMTVIFESAPRVGLEFFLRIFSGRPDQNFDISIDTCQINDNSLTGVNIIDSRNSIIIKNSSLSNNKRIGLVIEKGVSSVNLTDSRLSYNFESGVNITTHGGSRNISRNLISSNIGYGVAIWLNSSIYAGSEYQFYQQQTVIEYNEIFKNLDTGILHGNFCQAMEDAAVRNDRYVKNDRSVNFDRFIDFGTYDTPENLELNFYKSQPDFKDKLRNIEKNSENFENSKNSENFRDTWNFENWDSPDRDLNFFGKPDYWKNFDALKIAEYKKISKILGISKNSSFFKNFGTYENFDFDSNFSGSVTKNFLNFVNITGNLFKNSEWDSVEILTCQKIGAVLTKIQIGHNRFLENTRLGIKISPALNIEGRIEFNTFQKGKLGQIFIKNRALEAFTALPAYLKIEQNIFVNNFGLFVVNLGLSPYTNFQKIFFYRNFVRFNEISENPSQTPLIPRSNVAAPLVISSPDVTIFRNIFDNPKSKFEIGSHFENPNSVINCTFNYLGSKDEKMIFDRIFDRNFRYNLAVINFIPYLLHNSNPMASIIVENRRFVPYFWSVDSPKIGGEIDGVELLPSGVYEVERDINIRPGGKLILEPGTTLKFPSSLGILVAGKIEARGNGPDSIVFTLKEEPKFESTTLNYEKIQNDDENQKGDLKMDSEFEKHETPEVLKKDDIGDTTKKVDLGNNTMASATIETTKIDPKISNNQNFGQDGLGENLKVVQSVPKNTKSSLTRNRRQMSTDDENVQPHVEIFETPKIRLVGGKTEFEGRLQIFLDGKWGTVNKYNFDFLDAKIACNNLGYVLSNENWLMATDELPTMGTDVKIVATNFECTEFDVELTKCKFENYDNFENLRGDFQNGDPEDEILNFRSKRSQKSQNSFRNSEIGNFENLRTGNFENLRAGINVENFKNSKNRQKRSQNFFENSQSFQNLDSVRHFGNLRAGNVDPHDFDVGLKCLPVSWAGLKFSVVAEKSDLQFITITRAGLFDYNKNILKPALEIDYNRHNLEYLKIFENYHDGLGIVYSDVFDSNPILKNSEIFKNYGAGLALKTLGLQISGTQFTQNQMGIKFEPKISLLDQKEISTWFFQKNLPNPPLKILESQSLIYLNEFETKFLVSDPVKNENFIKNLKIQCPKNFVLGIQILNPISKFSTEKLLIMNSFQNVKNENFGRYVKYDRYRRNVNVNFDSNVKFDTNVKSDRNVKFDRYPRDVNFDSNNVGEDIFDIFSDPYNVKYDKSVIFDLSKNLTSFPFMSYSYSVDIYYKTGVYALGGLVLQVTAIRNVRNRNVKKVSKLTMTDSKIRQNDIGIFLTYENEYFDNLGPGHIFLRKANETLEILNSEISKNKNSALFLNSGTEFKNLGHLGEIAIFMNKSQIFENGDILGSPEGLRGSNNIFKIYFQDSIFENNFGPLKIRLPYTFAYNENFTHQVFCDNSTFVKNQNFEFGVHGHFSKINITNSKFLENQGPNSILSFSGMEKLFLIFQNHFSKNQGPVVIDFSIDSQTEIFGDVFAIFSKNILNQNGPKYQNNYGPNIQNRGLFAHLTSGISPDYEKNRLKRDLNGDQKNFENANSGPKNQNRAPVFENLENSDFRPKIQNGAHFESGPHSNFEKNRSKRKNGDQENFENTNFGPKNQNSAPDFEKTRLARDLENFENTDFGPKIKNGGRFAHFESGSNPNFEKNRSKRDLNGDHEIFENANSGPNIENRAPDNENFEKNRLKRDFGFRGPNFDHENYESAVYRDIFEKTAVIRFDGVQKVRINRNLLSDNTMAYNLIAGVRTAEIGNFLDAKFNYWGTTNLEIIESKIFHFDNWNNYAIANFKPYLLENSFGSSTSHSLPENSKQINFDNLGGRITEDVVIVKRDRPYIVQNDITVMPNVKMTIQPGVVMEFAPNVGILVLGTLKARGLKNFEIIMRPIQKNGLYKKRVIRSTDFQDGRPISPEVQFLESKKSDLESKKSNFKSKKPDFESKKSDLEPKKSDLKSNKSDLESKKSDMESEKSWVYKKSKKFDYDPKKVYFDLVRSYDSKDSNISPNSVSPNKSKFDTDFYHNFFDFDSANISSGTFDSIKNPSEIWYSESKSKSPKHIESKKSDMSDFEMSKYELENSYFDRMKRSMEGIDNESKKSELESKKSELKSKKFDLESKKSELESHVRKRRSIEKMYSHTNVRLCMDKNCKNFGLENSFQGFLEIFNSTTFQWVPICDLRFTELNAQVVCRNLGFYPKSPRSPKMSNMESKSKSPNFDYNQNYNSRPTFEAHTGSNLNMEIPLESKSPNKSESPNLESKLDFQNQSPHFEALKSDYNDDENSNSRLSKLKSKSPEKISLKSPKTIFFDFGHRIDYDSFSLDRIWTFMAPVECQGTESEFLDCQPKFGQNLDFIHNYRCRYDQKFVFINCDGSNENSDFDNIFENFDYENWTAKKMDFKDSRSENLQKSNNVSYNFEFSEKMDFLNQKMDLSENSDFSEINSYWGGIRFAGPTFENFEENRLHDPKHKNLENFSELEFVKIEKAGLLHGEKMPALQNIFESPKMKYVEISESAGPGVTFLSPKKNIEFFNSVVKNSEGPALSIFSLTGDGFSKISSYEPLNWVQYGAIKNGFSLIDICQSQKIIQVEEKILIYYIYSGSQKNCIKIFKTPYNQKATFGFRLLQFHLFNESLIFDRPVNFDSYENYDSYDYFDNFDFLQLFDGDIYNHTSKVMTTLTSKTPNVKQLYTTTENSLSVKLFANGASQNYGFIAEVVTLPVSLVVTSNRDLQHNISNSIFTNNFYGAIFYVSAGEINPIITLEQNVFSKNCKKFYGNFTSCKSALYFDIQNTQTLFFRNNLVEENQGGLFIRSDSQGSATSLKAWVHNNLFHKNKNLPTLKIVGRSTFPFQEVVMYKNYITQNHVRFDNVISLRQVMSNMTYNYVKSNWGMTILEVSGFEGVRLPIYQSTTHNGFYKNYALHRESRSTVVAGTSGQHYIDNIFFNPDNDYEMITVNRSRFIFDSAHNYDIRKPFIDATYNYWSYNETLAVQGRIRDYYDDQNLLEVLYTPYYLNNETILHGKCPPGWSPLGDTCYMYIGAPMTFENARKFCRSDNASMPYILGNYHLLHGFISRERKFYEGYQKVWVQDIDRIDHCTAFGYNSLDIEDCDSLKPFICEIDPKVVIDPLSWRGDIVITAILGTVALAIFIILLILGCWYSKSKYRHIQRLERRNSIRQSLNSLRSIGTSGNASGYGDTNYRRKLGQMSHKSTDTLTKTSDYKKMLVSNGSVESFEKTNYESSIDDGQSHFDIFECHNPNVKKVTDDRNDKSQVSKITNEYADPNNFGLSYQNQGFRDNSNFGSNVNSTYPSKSDILTDDTSVKIDGFYGDYYNQDTLPLRSKNDYDNSSMSTFKNYDTTVKPTDRAANFDSDSSKINFDGYGNVNYEKSKNYDTNVNYDNMSNDKYDNPPESVKSDNTEKNNFKMDFLIELKSKTKNKLPEPPEPPNLYYENSYARPLDQTVGLPIADLPQENNPQPPKIKTRSKSEALLETNFDSENEDTEFGDDNTFGQLNYSSRSKSQPLETAM